MYIARVKIKIKDKMEDTFYEKDKWEKLFKYKNKQCFWRITKDNHIEYVLGKYKNEKDALTDGKILYFNILYNLHLDIGKFDYGDDEYITRMYHENTNYTREEYINEEKWFINYKNNYADFCGLGVYELDNNLNKFDEIYEKINVEWKVINRDSFGFNEKIGRLNKKYKYSEKAQEIFNLISLSENADIKTEILLLSQAMETMGEDKEKSKKEILLIDTFIEETKKSNLNKKQKESLVGLMGSSKKISSSQKCVNLVKKYCKNNYKNFDKIKVVKYVYGLRSIIIHGGELPSNTKYNCVRQFKIIVLDVLKNWAN